MGREFKCHQDAGLLCFNGSITDGGDTEKSGYKEVFCQYDYGDKASFNELCGVAGIYKRHIQSVEKNAWAADDIFTIKNGGGTTPEFETTYFWLYPFVEKDYRLFNPDFSRTTMINNKELFYIISYFDGIYKYT